MTESSSRRNLVVTALCAVVLLEGHVGCASQAPQPVTNQAQNPVPPTPLPEEVASIEVDLQPITELGVTDQSPGGISINRGPVFVYVASDDQGPFRVYSIGHAEGSCCRAISEEFTRASNDAPMEEAWFAFGFIRMTSGNVPAARQRLATLTAKVRELARTGSCQGEVVFNAMKGDRIETRSRSIKALAGTVLNDAKAMKRTIVVVHDSDRDVPALVQVDLPNGKPLSVRLPKEDVDMPTSLASSGLFDGLDQYVSVLREELERIDRIEQAQRLAQQLNGRVALELGERQIETNYRGDAESTLLADARLIQDAIARWTTLGKIADLLGDGNVREGVDEGLRRLGDCARSNQAGLALARTLPSAPRSNQPTAIQACYAAEYEAGPELQELRSFPVKARRSEALRALEEAQDLPSQAATKGEYPLLDAMLRGWNATMRDPDAERQFDAWLQRRQVAVLHRLTELAAKQHRVSLGDFEKDSPLRMGELLFHISETEGEYNVTPYIVVSGTAYQVANPARGCIYYESSGC